MLVKFNGVWLTNDGTGAILERAWTSTQDARLDGREVIEEVQPVRGTYSIFFDRLNPSHSLTFQVTRNFQLLYPAASNPIALASSFAMTHFAGLTKNGTLLLTCGGWGETPIVAQALGTVMPSSSSSARGVSVTTSYALQFGTISIPA